MSTALQTDTQAKPRFRLMPIPRLSGLARRGGKELVADARAMRLPSGRVERSWRDVVNWVSVSFTAMVLVPVGAAVAYYGFIASPIYVSETKFAIRGAVEGLPKGPALESFSPLTAMNSNQDAHVVAGYIGSLPLVEKLQASSDMRTMFSRPEVDWYARLDPAVSAEKLKRYWNKRVTSTIDNLSGVITLQVTAFTPSDALTLSRGVIAESETLVNQMSARRNADAVKFAQEEVDRSEKRVKAALLALQDFRNESGLLDPVKQAEAALKLATQLRGERIILENELAAARRTLSDNAPSVQVLTSRLNGIKDQLQTVEKTITGETRDARTASRALFRYETLELEKAFAEKVYIMSQASYERARVNAERQNLYLSTFVTPALAQMAMLPRRGSEIFTIATVALALWSVMALAAASVRDHNS